MCASKFVYEVPSVAESEFPVIDMPEGAQIASMVPEPGEVTIVGNSKGLAYLARHLIAMSLLSKKDGFHVHLDPEVGQVASDSCFVTIRNVDFDVWTE